MIRYAQEQLEQWYHQPQHRPLVVSGVRQCGKTWLIQEFGATHYGEVLYINFEQDSTYASVFEYDFDVKRIVRDLSALVLGRPFDPRDTLIIFDEIQECPRAITSLKYFCENETDYHLICAGSLLGIEMKRKRIAFPVGKIDRLRMYPMSFPEFLQAVDEKKLYETAVTYIPDSPVPEAFTRPLHDYLRLYLITGGMPYVVKRFMETRDYTVVDRELDTLLSDYRDDFSKHADAKDIQKLSQVWTSVPAQLAKDNQKFVFAHVHEGARARDLEDAVQWLVDAGLVYKLTKVSHPEIPLSACADDTFFKLYMADTGLLRRLAGISYTAFLTEPEAFQKTRGAITENFILTELIAMGYHPYYWKNDNTAEVDFLIEHETGVIPVEVKNSMHTRAKSFALYCKNYRPRIAVKTSLKNVGITQKDKTCEIQMPLYLFPYLGAYMEKAGNGGKSI